MTSTPVRRGLAAALASTLAATALGLTAPRADAVVTDGNPDASITPTSVQPRATTTFTVTVEGVDSDKAEVVTIGVPAAFGSATSPSSAAPSGWAPATYDSATRTFTFTAPANRDKLGTGQKVTATITAVAPASPGTYTWPVGAKPNQNPNSSIVVSPQPVVTVTNPTQTIGFAPLADRVFGEPDFTVSATGGPSGNPVTFTASGACTSGGTDGATIHLVGAGSCSVRADQAGGNGYQDATPVTRTFSVAQGSQTITFPGIGTRKYGDAPVTLDATASSGLPVSYATEGPCVAQGSELRLTGAGTCTVTASQAGNANWKAAQPQSVSFSVTKASAVLRLGGLTAAYDGLPHHATAATTPAGLEGVTVAYSRDGKPVTDPRDAGTYDVTATLDNADYAAETVVGTLVIAQRHVRGAFTAEDREYDGTTEATVLTRSLEGAVDGDDVELSGGTATFDAKDAGDRTATLSDATLTGDDAANYLLDVVSTASATISPRSVTASVVAADKTYDGTRLATATPQALAGRIGSDDVAVVVDSAEFDGTGVSQGRTVTAVVHLAGADAHNYVLTSRSTTATANIWAKPVLGGFTADGRTYDGTTTATVHPAPLAGVVADDDVQLLVGDAFFDTKDVGSQKPVTASLRLVGADASNYVLEAVAGTAYADITPATVTGGFKVADKQWDGTTAATITERSLSGAVAGDDVRLVGGTAGFASPAVGTAKQVSGSGFELAGTDAGNYVLASDRLTTTASITPLYSGKGFFAPVDMTPAGSGTRVFNTVKGGQTVPLKFELFDARTGVEQTSLGALGADATQQAAAFKVTTVSCTATPASEDPVELTTTGGTSVRYDTAGGQYVQNWKTPTALGCYSVAVTAVDGTRVGAAYFKILK